MAAEIATIAVAGAEAGAEKIAGSITEVFIQQFKDCYNLEKNHELLNENVEKMFLDLCDDCTRFRNEWVVLPDPVEKCMTKMVDAAKKAKELSVRIEERRSRCFDCWNLCYPKLSTECREWNTKLADLTKEYSKIFAKAVATSAKAGPALPLPVPADGLLGSDIESAKRQLQEWLTQSNPPHRVVGVWGMGGIGKTTLLKIIHNHFQKVSSIFDIVIWVTVSQNLKAEEFYNSIAKALDMKLEEKFDINRERTKVCKFLENKKFLLILDDLWERIDFGEVGFSFGNHPGSRVLISTRNYRVIEGMGAKDSCWKMNLLSEEEAWKVFKSKAFTNGPAALDRNIEAIAREIAKKCQGLPLAVNAVGAAMISNETKEEWSRASTLMGTPDQDFQGNIDKQLRYSYDVLSNKLKICFLYSAAFPEDAEIDADSLVEIWIAEGVLGLQQTTLLMDVGREYLNQLAKRCLIDYYVVPIPSYDHSMRRRIKVHDVLREMAIRIGKSEEHCLFATNQRLEDFPREIEVSNCKRISLGHNDIQDLPNNLMKCPNLVSLLLPSNQKLSHVPEQFLRSVTSLRVLDLSNTGITGLPISVGELRLLEFLDLSCCQKLIELPESIGNLSALQFFNLESCWKLKGLPSTIRGLKKLKHLNLDWCNMQVNSDDIGQLISLNRLVVGDNIQYLRAGDLINLTKMRVLKASVRADGGDVVTIDTWTEMKHLTLDFYSDGAVKIEKIERVEILQLYRYGGVTLPHCEFQNLKVLRLERCNELRELPLRSFPMLTVLKLEKLSKLESLSGPSNVSNEGSMSKLQELKISGCSLLKKLLLGMRLPNLKVLDIRMCDSIKELDIGNGDFPMLELLILINLKELESITGSSGVWNEEATSNLESVYISACPLLRGRLPRAMKKLFRLNKLKWVVLPEFNTLWGPRAYDDEILGMLRAAKNITIDEDELFSE